jgi:hypothetical protein
MIGSENRSLRITSAGMLFPIMRPAKIRPGPLACEASHRIKDAGYRRKQERVSDTASGPSNPLISPENMLLRQGNAAAAFRTP